MTVKRHTMLMGYKNLTCQYGMSKENFITLAKHYVVYLKRNYVNICSYMSNLTFYDIQVGQVTSIFQSSELQ